MPLISIPVRGQFQTSNLAWLLALGLTIAHSSAVAADDVASDLNQGLIPDLQKETIPGALSKGNLVVVPIPFSNPTLDSGLMLGAGYFHAQTEQQKATQPASVTGIGVMATGNESKGVAAGNASYWNEDRWRLTTIAAWTDLNLPLLVPGENTGTLELDWLLSGTFVQAEIQRRLGDNWYMGVSGRWIELDQAFNIDFFSPDFVLRNSFTDIGIGMSLTFDTRDMPTNAYSGNYFKISAMSSKTGDAGDRYDAFNARFAQYHQLKPRLVLAWEVAGCRRSGDVPLWDACRIGLRGFANTDYMAPKSYRAQTELRWQLSERWGAAAFAGGGWIDDTLSGRRDRELVPSVGFGLRFMVQKANRINMRLDFAKSHGSEAVILSVMEAF